MAISLDKNRQKRITMELNVEGIEKDKLNYTFRIEGDNCELGFPGKLISENKLQIEIPPLKSVGFVKKGNYTASLEVDDNDRYFMKPWEGEIQIESNPEVTAVYEDELKGTESEKSISVESIDDKDVGTPIQETEEKKPEKWSKEKGKKFVHEARERLKDRDPEVVDEYIAQELKKHGLNYTPKSRKGEGKKQTKRESSKTSKPSYPTDSSQVKSKDDIIKYLNAKGIKKESSVESIMERAEANTDGSLKQTFDMLKSMLESTGEDPIQNSRMNTLYEEHSTASESDKEQLREKLQAAKANMEQKYSG